MNYMKTGLLLVALSALLIFCGRILGGSQGVVIAFIFALVMQVGSFWFSDRIVLSMYRASELPESEYPQIYSIVRELSGEAGIPVPRVYMAPSEAPNAFATGRSPDTAVVCVTAGLLRMLDRNELKGVIAHEIAHIKNRDTLIMTVAATVASAIMMLASMARWAMIFGGYGGRGGRDRDGGNIIGLLAMAIIAPLAAMLIQMAISRSREYGADAAGARFACGGEGLSRALRKLSDAKRRVRMPASPQTAHLFIVNPLTSGFLVSLFSTHPPVEERIRRLANV